MKKKTTRKTRATKTVKNLPLKALSVKHTKSVRGGRKAGEKPLEFLKIK